MPEPATSLEPNHNLWCNHGWWHLSLTVYPDAYTKERIRWPFRTRSLQLARERRDELMTAARLGGLLNRENSDTPRMPLESLRAWASERFRTRQPIGDSLVHLPTSIAAEEKMSVLA